MISYTDDAVTIYGGDVLAGLARIESETVQTCVTSPPYWGLRDYGTAQWEGGDAGCDHLKPAAHGYNPHETSTLGPKRDGLSPDNAAHANGVKRQQYAGECQKCGARRIDQQIGLEPTPDAYVQKMVEVFREVRRVLKEDGTLWLNLGSSFSSAIIESERYIIRRGLPDEKRIKIAQALSQVWSGHASPESAMQRLLEEDACKAGELSGAHLPEVPEGIHGSQVPCRARTREVLQSFMCSVGQPNEEASTSPHDMLGVRQGARTVSCRHAEESDQEGFLQSDVLVQPQSEGQPLSLVRGTRRTHESGRREVEKGGSPEGQVSLPDLSHEQETRSPSHSTIQNAQSGTLANIQRVDSVSGLPQEHSSARNGVRGYISVHRFHSCPGLENIAFSKSSIPSAFLGYCEPESVYKPKDLINIPHLVADALRGDGWYLRSDIIWYKPNALPESVTDRVTKAHEYIFLLSKRERYYYDRTAILEPQVCASQEELEARISTKDRYAETNGDGKGFRGPFGGKDGPRLNPLGRNKRTVWEVATQPYSGAHFAVFPEKLIEPCILAGSRSGDTVLDPFAGSGTTLAVSKRLGRKAIGIELNPDYIDLATIRVGTTARSLF